jgi:hypothetical protein
MRKVQASKAANRILFNIVEGISTVVSMNDNISTAGADETLCGGL